MKYALLFILSAALTLNAYCSAAQSRSAKYTDAPGANAKTPYPIVHNDAQWKEQLTPDQYYILRQQGTERAGTGKYDHFYKKGIYYSAATLQPVFSSDTKFDSHTGWPSFFAPISPDAVRLVKDNSDGMERWEVVASKSASHLGHVFNDVPSATCQTYSMNST